MQCHDVKELIGSLPSPEEPMNQLSTMDSTTSKANLNKVNQPITNTGKSSASLRKKRQSTKSKKYLVLPKPTTSLPDQVQLKPMSGKKKQELANHLNLERSLLKETPPPTGKKFEILPNKETLTTFPPTYSFVVILHCVESVRIIFNQLRWSALPLFTGVRLALESHIVHGLKEELIHTIKIHVPNSGMATLIRQQLYSMNLEVRSTSPTSCDGLTSIQSVWKLKDLPKYSWPPSSTLPATSTQTDGTPTSMKLPMKRLNEDSK